MTPTDRADAMKRYGYALLLVGAAVVVTRLLDSRKDDLDASTCAMAAQSIENSTRTQAMLVDDLLDVSRIILGKLEIQREAVFLREIVEEAIQLIGPTAAEKSIDIETRFEGQLVVRGTGSSRSSGTCSPTR